MSHTPTPWRLNRPHPTKMHEALIGGDGSLITYFKVDVSLDDAEFLIRAVNAHADLVAALESILEMTQEDECTRSNSSRVYEIGTYARLAIAKAKGQSA